MTVDVMGFNELMADDLEPIHVMRNGRRVQVRAWSPGETRSGAIAGASHLAESIAAHDADAAIQVYEQVLAMQLDEHGGHDPRTLETVWTLGSLLNDEGRVAEALGRYEQLAAGWTLSHGADHPNALAARAEAATALQRLGRTAEASERYAEMLPSMLRVRGPEDERTAVSANNYGVLLLAAGQHAAAQGWLTTAIPGLIRHFGPHHTATLSATYDLAECLAALGQTAQARDLHEAVLTARRTALAADHPEVRKSERRLAELTRPKRRRFPFRRGS